MAESNLQADLLIALGARPDLTVWRNNTGALPTAGGGLMTFGLKGSSDVLGVAKPGGWFVAIEVKKPGKKRSPQQERFAAMVVAHGGIYVLADRSVEIAVQELDHQLAVKRGQAGKVA